MYLAALFAYLCLPVLEILALEILVFRNLNLIVQILYGVFLKTHLNAQITFLNAWSGDFSHWIQKHKCQNTIYNWVGPGNVRKENIWVKKRMSPKADVILDFFQSTWEDKMDRLKVGWQQNAFHRGGVLFLFIQCAILPHYHLFFSSG